MNIFLDSSAIISYLKGDGAVRDIIESADKVFTSSLCAFEVLVGENYLQMKGHKSGGEAAAFLEGTTITNLDERDAEIAAEAQARLIVKGTPQNAMDILIAASAARNEAEMATKDRDYEAIQEVLGFKVRKV